MSRSRQPQSSSALTSSPSSALPTRHICHCGKSFSRKEHLTRHKKTHEQPAYVCETCRRRFNRKELLRRHSALHDPHRTRVVVSCDACRANKTKCSGGTPCSLCARRSIECTFRSSHRRSQRLSTASISEAVNTDPRNDDNDNADIDEDSTSRSITRREVLPEGLRVRTDQAPLSQDWFQHLETRVIPSKPINAGAFQPLSLGIGAIYELLLVENSSLEAATQGSRELQEWLDKCLETYFTCFHLRWPLLPAPVFDVTDEPLLLAASVCVIGTWLQAGTTSHEKRCVLRIHEILLQRLLHVLIDSESIPEAKAWPIDLLAAVLLTLIFSLYRSDKNVMTGTLLLRATFITVLREKGVLDAETRADHLRSHFTGTYAPYTISNRERFTRLVALAYQFDVYFALAYHKPPILHRQEIGADLTMTFAFWNAHGLDVFAKRFPDEPKERTGIKISAMTNDPDSFKASPLLVEDILLGLCGIFQAIWVFSRSSTRQTKGHHRTSFQRMLLLETLDSWKHELDKIHKLADARSITSDAARYLFLAYRGKDDSVPAIVERIRTLVQDGMVLYHYLKMCHHAGPSSHEHVERALHTANANSNINVGANAIANANANTNANANAGTSTSSSNRRSTKDEREAVMCAIDILRIAESTTTANNTSINPLTRHGLALGIHLTRKILTQCDRCECECECERPSAWETGQHIPPLRPPPSPLVVRSEVEVEMQKEREREAETEAERETDAVQQWVETGGPLRLDDVPYCVCALEHWIERFERAIQAQTIQFTNG